MTTIKITFDDKAQSVPDDPAYVNASDINQIKLAVNQNADLLALAVSNDLEFKVGTTGPNDGDTLFDLTTLIPHGYNVRLFRGRVKQSKLDMGDGSTFSYSSTSSVRQLTVTRAFQLNELIQIEPYKI